MTASSDFVHIQNDIGVISTIMIATRQADFYLFANLFYQLPAYLYLPLRELFSSFRSRHVRIFQLFQYQHNLCEKGERIM